MDISTIDKTMLSESTLFEDHPELKAVTFAGKVFESNSTQYNFPGNGKNDVISKPELNFYKSIQLQTEWLANIRQVHDNKIKVVSEPGYFGEFDGLITDKRNIYLRVVTADCLPVFFYDPVSSSIGLAHAGWRGLNAKIANKVTIQMQSGFKTKPGNLLVAVGPFIRECCYSVKEDVASLFAAEYAKPVNNGKYMIDLGKIMTDQLTGLGIMRNNIEISKECTSCLKERFSSARRDGLKSGRNISLIGLVDNN